jgi:hypothetical protein
VGHVVGSIKRLVDEYERTNSFQDLGIDGTMVLKYIRQELAEAEATRFT